MPAVDFATKYASARERLLREMSALQWCSRHQLESWAGNRYGARIRELRRLGYPIEDREVEDGKEYRLISATPTGPTAPKKVRVYLNEGDAVDLINGRLSMFARCDLQVALGKFRMNKERL